MVRTHGATVGTLGGYAGVTAAWASANAAYYFPMWLSEPTTITQAFFETGTASGNVDLGIYDATFVRKVSSGSTAASVTNGTQVINLTDTLLDRGYYWMAMAADNTTLTVRRVSVGLGYVRLLGFFQQASAFALPATATPAAIATTSMPIFGFTTRATL